jgi:hypothetical protein
MVITDYVSSLLEQLLNSLRGACSSDLEPRKQNRRLERISTTRGIKKRKLRSRRMKSTRMRNIRRKGRQEELS